MIPRAQQPSRSFKADRIPIPSALAPGAEFWQSTIPTDLEIGAGVGWHAVRYGIEHADRRLIAIEHTQEKFEKLARRLSHHPDVKNVLAVHANAIHWVTHFVPQQSLSRIFLLFPNPHPKGTQSNQRWHRMPFFERLLDSLMPGGTFTLATNEAFYAEEALAVLSANQRLSLVDKRVYSLAAPAPWGIRTHFEKKYLEAGQTCTQLIFELVDKTA